MAPWGEHGPAIMQTSWPAAEANFCAPLALFVEATKRPSNWPAGERVGAQVAQIGTGSSGLAGRQCR